jgi:hypothetical protein
VHVPAKIATSRRWVRWITAGVVASTIVTLATTVAYQNTVTIPQLKRAGSPSRVQIRRPSFSLPADAPGVWTPQVTIRPPEGFLLNFKVNPTYQFNSYFCQLQDAAGNLLLQTKVSGEEVNKELRFAVPPGVVQRPGSYSLILVGADFGSATPAGNSVVQRVTFTILFAE